MICIMQHENDRSCNKIIASLDQFARHLPEPRGLHKGITRDFVTVHSPPLSNGQLNGLELRIPITHLFFKWPRKIMETPRRLFIIYFFWKARTLFGVYTPEGPLTPPHPLTVPPPD